MTVHVAVQRGDLPDTTATYGWTVGGPPEQTRPVVVSTAPLGPGLRMAAAVLLLALLGVGLLAMVVRLHGRRAPGRRTAVRRPPARYRRRTPISAVEYPPSPSTAERNAGDRSNAHSGVSSGSSSMPGATTRS